MADSDPNALFRSEALRFRADRLHGAVNVAIPISWKLIGALLVIAFFGGVIILSQIPYARAENVKGAIVSDVNATIVVSGRPGTIGAVSVREGQRVQARQPLLLVDTGEQMADGGTSQERLLGELRSQLRLVDAQRQAAGANAVVERSRIDNDSVGFAAEVRFLDRQIAAQRTLVDSAAEAVRSAELVARSGFISARDIQARRDLVLSRQQQLAQLEQTRASKIADRDRQVHLRAQIPGNTQAQLAQLESTRAELLQRITTLEAARGYIVLAPASGIVTAITVQTGQHVIAERRLMTIVPDASRVEVELTVPTASAGFIAVGQRVEVAIDAYPRQRYGTLDAVIQEISTVPMPVESEEAGADPAYLVRAIVSPESIRRFEAGQPIRRGMAVAASIITHRDTLLGWLMASF